MYRRGGGKMRKRERVKEGREGKEEGTEGKEEGRTGKGVVNSR